MAESMFFLSTKFTIFVKLALAIRAPTFQRDFPISGQPHVLMQEARRGSERSEKVR